MSDAPVATAPVTPKGKRRTPKSPKSAGGSKKARSNPNHPPISEMVNAAISNLKERSGSSSQAIKKYIASSYKVDVERLTPFIKKYLKSGVTTGGLIQTKGKGASGSFKLAKDVKEKKKSEETRR